MSKTRLEKGLARWNELADLLNAISQEPDGITVNDKRIWLGILHDWDNDDWELYLEAVGELLEGHPAFFKKHHKEAFIAASKAFLGSKNEHPRCLDQKHHKKHAWRMIMCGREIWNEIDEHYSNRADVIIRPRVEFSQLFN